MSTQNSTALTKRSASSALMPPPVAPKRIKRPSIVLDEDTYTSAVSHIIRRDFFPGLAETDAQREYLNALESKDKSWIREAGKKLTQVMTPVPNGRRRVAERTRFATARAMTPIGTGGKTPSVWGDDTPALSVIGTEMGEEQEEGLGKLDKVDLNMSLGAFQAKYTSEDQESFSQLIDKHNENRFEKNAWLREGNRLPSKQRIAQQKVIEARSSTPDSASKEVILRPSQNLEDRPAAPNTHKHSAFNSLMFNPESIESWAPTRSQVAETASLAPSKQVVYSNTRLPVVETQPPRPPSPTMSSVRDAISGRPRLNPSEGGYTGSETPRVNGYAFVDADPPSPSSDHEPAPEDLLDKFGVNGEASKATPFRIDESSRRERLHHKMVERINLKNTSKSDPSSSRDGAISSSLGIFDGETPRFRSAPTLGLGRGAVGMMSGRKHAGSLTPAAQRLFEKVGGGTPRNTGSGGFGGERRSNKEWTPTPRVKRKI